MQTIPQSYRSKAVKYWREERNKYQQNRTQSPKIHPGTYGHLVFDKGKNIQQRKDSLFNKWCWKNWTATCKRVKLEHPLTPNTKINSKWIEDLNVRLDTIKVLRGKHRQNTLWHKLQHIFFDPLPKVMKTKTKLNKWDLIKFKSFCIAKDTINKTNSPKRAQINSKQSKTNRD